MQIELGRAALISGRRRPSGKMGASFTQLCFRIRGLEAWVATAGLSRCTGMEKGAVEARRRWWESWQMLSLTHWVDP
jgi:hypothetical protein